MKSHINIHDTAFVTCLFRANHPDISKDRFAHLWINDGVAAWRDAYVNAVSPEEPIAHAMRNRFFLDTINRLKMDGKVEMLINFGAGFSMYPFLLDESISHIEIDKPELVEFKNQRVGEWIKNGKLPKRDIKFLGVDFDEDYVDNLIENLLPLTENKSSFILIEGVLFFLSLRQAADLFSLFNNIQNSGFIGSASYEPEILEYRAFKRLQRFMNANVNPEEPQHYLSLPKRFYEDLPNYNLIDHQDFFSLAKEFGYETQKGQEDILNENFYIIEKA